MSLTVHKKDFQLLQGELKTFSRAADSGRDVQCAFCPDCGTRIYHEPRLRKDAINIKAGTFDDTTFLQPAVQVWTIRKHPWVGLPPDLVSFERQPG
jgi:hypothetical protein